MGKCKWTPVGGCDSNHPGIWDDGHGSLIYVSQHEDGTVRRVHVRHRGGPGGDRKRFWPAGSTLGMHPEISDGPAYTTASSARRAIKRNEAADDRRGRIIDSGWDAYAREEGHYDDGGDR